MLLTATGPRTLSLEDVGLCSNATANVRSTRPSSVCLGLTMTLADQSIPCFLPVIYAVVLSTTTSASDKRCRWGVGVWNRRRKRRDEAMSYYVFLRFILFVHFYPCVKLSDIIIPFVEFERPKGQILILFIYYE